VVIARCPERRAVRQRLIQAGIPSTVIDSNLRTVKDGDRVDLGGRSLKIIEVPGHTSGSIVVFDEGNGILISGDSFGSNSPTVPDALWMQIPGSPSIDTYLSSIRVAHAEFRGKVKAIVTGHNDRPLIGETYLDKLEAAAQLLVDKGGSVLVPSYRPAGVLQVVVGDRLKDPNWVAINVNRDRFLSAPPDKIASLSNIEISGAELQERFSPARQTYSALASRDTKAVEISPIATSTRRKVLTINGAAVSGKPYALKLHSPQTDVTIVVTSPDGSVSTRYSLSVSKPD
jgi:hypothetical protein